MFYTHLMYFLIMVSVNRCALYVCDRRTLILALFPDLPTGQFLIIYSMQKWRGKAWSILTCKWCQCLQRGGGVPYRKDELEAFSCCVYPSTGVLNIHKAENYHLIFMDVGNAFCWLMTPSPLCLDIYVIKWATPSHHAVFAYCKWSKTGRWEGLGMKVLLFLQLSAECQPTHTILTDPERFHNNNIVFFTL